MHTNVKPMTPIQRLVFVQLTLMLKQPTPQAAEFVKWMAAQYAKA